MHYRTERITFLDTADAFLDRIPHVKRTAGSAFDTEDLPGEQPIAVVPAAP